MAAVCVMMLGTSSGAGKSWITTALCRYYANQGLKVAPFKAQNMSNNARVVDAGDREGEIGSAQYFQALAAKATPNVQMNPVLLKPEADTRSQVIVMGRVDSVLSGTPWRARSEKLWPEIQTALDCLIESYDVVVIEGAGSPAEINLMTSDIVNLRVARYAKAKCLLVTDIDRGGAFAHLYGTWALLEKSDQQLITGFVLNKFRGDAALLAPGPEMLQDLTGIPVVATIPMLRGHGLPEEDGVFDERTSESIAGAIKVAVIAYPRISNLDEFQSLKNTKNVKLIWAREPKDLLDVDWIILPGSKHTSADLDWLRAQGLDQVVCAHALAGKRVLGICGGLQMLEAELKDPHGVDGSRKGLNLLPLETVFEQDKTVKNTQAQFALVKGSWSFLSGLPVSGYEIHHGETTLLSPVNNEACEIEIIPNIAWINSVGNVMGIYWHGLFENNVVMEALFQDASGSLDAVFERLAEHFAQHSDSGLLNSLILKS
jgi:adenosylcobyric acid synthase